MKYLLILIAVISLNAQEMTSLSGLIKTDFRSFSEKGLYSSQENTYLSFAFEPKFYMEWNDGKQTINFTGFVRWDQHDDERTHEDIRELYWQYIANGWELSIGFKKVFWGVIETNHLVDIINQTDVVESFDGEQKLGQPMLHFSYPSAYGTFDAFVLPYFRERHFPSEKGRLRFPFDIDTKHPIYESSRKEKHIDAALRYTHSIDVIDFGISHFYGTNREASFIFSGTALRPFYDLINQTSLDLQATTDLFLYKLEYIRRESDAFTYSAFSAGLEYTFWNLSNSGIDVGLVSEYHFDDRIKNAAGPLNNDIFIGSRIAFNDEQSMEFLIGSMIDLKNESQIFSIEGSRRIGSSWKLNIELRAFTKIAHTDQLYNFRNDSFMQFTLANYF